jgi:hypothetical protein
MNDSLETPKPNAKSLHPDLGAIRKKFNVAKDFKMKQLFLAREATIQHSRFPSTLSPKPEIAFPKSEA